MTPLYSIIIPHKNIPDLLVRCIKSIPIREDVQIIVVDDNSDDAETYLRRFPELSRPNLELYLTKEGNGAGYARNYGMQYAKGEWVLFADADDFFIEGWLDIVDKDIEREQDVVEYRITSCMSNEPNQEYSSEWHNALFDQYKKNAISARDLLFYRPTPWAKLIKRQFLINKNFRFEEVRYSNDMNWAYHVAAEAENIGISMSKIYCVTQREGSLTTILDVHSTYARYEVVKRCREYAIGKGFLQFQTPPVIEFLIKFRKFGILQYAKFVIKERKEIFRTHQNATCNVPFNYRHPWLYVLLVFCRVI